MEEYESIFLSLDIENSGEIDIEGLKKSVEKAKVPSINDATRETVMVILGTLGFLTNVPVHLSIFRCPALPDYLGLL